MAKVSYAASPSFPATVKIHQPGGEPRELEMTFKHRTRDQLKELMDRLKELKDPEMVAEVASGWELSEAFSASNIAQFLQDHHSAAVAIWNTYVDQLTGLRLGN